MFLLIKTKMFSADKNQCASRKRVCTQTHTQVHIQTTRQRDALDANMIYYYHH